MLSQFKEQFPQCRFEVKAEDTLKCLQMLTLGEIDLAITLEPIKCRILNSFPALPMN